MAIIVNNGEGGYDICATIHCTDCSPPLDCCSVRSRAVQRLGSGGEHNMCCNVTQLVIQQDVRLSNLTEKLYLTEQSQCTALDVHYLSFRQL